MSDIINDIMEDYKEPERGIAEMINSVDEQDTEALLEQIISNPTIPKSPPKLEPETEESLLNTPEDFGTPIPVYDPVSIAEPKAVTVHNGLLNLRLYGVPLAVWAVMGFVLAIVFLNYLCSNKDGKNVSE